MRPWRNSQSDDVDGWAASGGAYTFLGFLELYFLTWGLGLVTSSIIRIISDSKSWLIGKDPDAGKDWGQEEKGMTEDEVVGWNYRFSGHASKQTPRNGEGQGSLGAIGHWVTKSLTWQLKNNNEKSLERGCCSPIHSWFGLRMGREEVLTRFYSCLQNSSPSFYSWNFFNAFIALD